MNQRGFIPVSLIMYAVGALAVMAAVGVVVWKIQNWCNTACIDARAETATQTARADAAEAAIQKAKDEAAAIAVKYGEQVAATQAAEVKREGERNARFEPLVAAARNLPAAVARVPFPADASRVLDDAISAGNATIAQPAADPDQAAAATPTATAGDNVDVAGVTAWGVAVARLYSGCVDQVRGWIDFYAGLQQAER